MAVIDAFQNYAIVMATTFRHIDWAIIKITLHVCG